MSAEGGSARRLSSSARAGQFDRVRLCGRVAEVDHPGVAREFPAVLDRPAGREARLLQPAFAELVVTGERRPGRPGVSAGRAGDGRVGAA
jgi:hypothetical protein